MRKKTQIFRLAMFLAISVLSVSCQKDDMESITLKSSGNLAVTILNGEEPVANAELWLLNGATENEIDVVLTDEDGKIDFGKLNEGTYVLSLEIESPKYTRIYQEVQVISGESVSKVVQIGDYVGTYTVALFNWGTNEAVQEDLGLGLAMIPENDAYHRSKSDEERIALATAIEYFGAEGQLVFEELPMADYNVFAVRGDSIISQVNEIEMNKLGELYWEYSVKVVDEKLFNNTSWTVGSVKDETDADVPAFPVAAVKFFKTSNSGNRFEMTMENGVVLSGRFDTGYDGSYLNLYSYSSSNPDFGFNISVDEFQMDEQGKLILSLNYFNMNDYTGDADFSDNDLRIILE